MDDITPNELARLYLNNTYANLHRLRNAHGHNDEPDIPPSIPTFPAVSAACRLARNAVNARNHIIADANDAGASYSRMSEALSIPRTTLAAWVKNARDDAAGDPTIDDPADYFTDKTIRSLADIAAEKLAADVCRRAGLAAAAAEHDETAAQKADALIAHGPLTATDIALILSDTTNGLNGEKLSDTIRDSRDSDARQIIANAACDYIDNRHGARIAAFCVPDRD